MVIVGWWIAPVISLVVFFIVTGVHFAQGDAAFILDGESKALRAAARGILPLSLPGAFHPQEYVSAITLVLESLQSSSASLAVYVVPLSWIGTAIAAAATLWSWRKGAGLDDLRELTGLVLLFAIATPLLAIGLYLALWHGWRHGLRISQLRTGRATIGGLVEAMRASGVTIAVSVFGFLAVIGAFAASGAPLPSVLGPTIAFLAALTVPHVAVVTLLDRGCADAGPRIKAPGGR
jgi:Brp/Blh family beta-carotene 15,15'-monooxygenase